MVDMIFWSPNMAHVAPSVENCKCVCLEKLGKLGKSHLSSTRHEFEVYLTAKVM